MEKGLDISLAERLSLLFLFSLSCTHIHTYTNTYIYIYIYWLQKMQQFENKKNVDRCPSFGNLKRFGVWVICTISGCNIIILYRKIFVLNVRNWFHLFDLNGIKCWIHFNNDVAFYSASLKKRLACFRFFCDFNFIYFYFFLPSGVLLVGTSLYSPHAAGWTG